jgi:hypothetical protein
MICSMQTHIAKQMPGMKVGYVDPQPIAQTNFNYPNQWKLDGKELAAGKTAAEKDAIWEKKIRDEALKVAAYIALSFKKLQHNDCIWVPYNFK